MAIQLNDIVASLYTAKPSTVLYHYTSLDSIPNIVRDGGLWATDIHYFNDSKELRHTVELLLSEIRARQASEMSALKLFAQLECWVGDRIANGHTLFVASFTAEGNLLSQWRGYCKYGRGLSVGISREHLLNCAADQQFSVGRCIYAYEEQREIAAHVVDAIKDVALSVGEAAPSKAHPAQSYYPAFAGIEGDLLRLAAILKSPAFREEGEWRAVSPVVSDYVRSDISYRPGRSTLIPYRLFSLTRASASAMELEHVFLGPTPNINLSMKSLSEFFSRNAVGPRSGITASHVPYRET